MIDIRSKGKFGRAQLVIQLIWFGYTIARLFQCGEEGVFYLLAPRRKEEGEGGVSTLDFNLLGLSYARNEGVRGHHRRHLRLRPALLDEQAQNGGLQAGRLRATPGHARGRLGRPVPTHGHDGLPGSHQAPVHGREPR